MTAKKFAVSFPEELHAEAVASARASGISLSAWLARAAGRALESEARLADGLAAVAELELEHGPITPSAADRAWVAEVLEAAGTPR